MNNKDGEEEDSPTKRVLSTAPPLSSNTSSMDPSNSNVAETPLGHIDPSSSAPSTVNLLSGSSLRSAAALPLGPSSSTVTPPPTVDLLSGSSLSSAAASSTVTPTPDDVDLSLGLAFPGVNTSQDASSSSRNVRKKQRALNFPMTRINIGNWTQTAANSRELIAKCYFITKQFVWEIMSEVETDTGLRKQVKKMEIDWDSVLSFKAEHDCFQIELSKPPRFRTERKDYHDMGVWKHIDHFAENHPSSTCRRHALFFDPQVLKTNYEKIVEDVFWSTTKNVQFPSLPNLLFSGDGAQYNLEADTHAGEKRKFDQIS